MATVKHVLVAGESLGGSAGIAPVDVIQGTAFPVERILFDASLDEARFFKLTADNYGSGDWTFKIRWYAVNATTGTVRWEIAMAAITPKSAAVNVETKAFAAAVIVDDAHLGATSKRLHEATIVVTGANRDGVAEGDDVRIRLRRIGSHAVDTMANDAAVTEVRVSYSDT
ncbi:hypothetical protein [Streptosporangium sp. NPDC087985]|uniref:hypothetical protein n=1 Tax=Streptosporangium sp. NPDC087985 TaxID=3366196 RepID=UPI00382888F5